MKRALAELLIVAAYAIGVGAFTGNLIGRDLLDLSAAWQTVLWFVGAGPGVVAGVEAVRRRRERIEGGAPSAVSQRRILAAGLLTLAAILVLVAAPDGWDTFGGVALALLAVLIVGSALLDRRREGATRSD